MKIIISAILNILKSEYGLTKEAIQSQSRYEELVYARRIIVHYMAKYVKGGTAKMIADEINRDRCTVIHILKTNDDQYGYNLKYKDFFDTVSMAITSKYGDSWYED